MGDEMKLIERVNTEAMNGLERLLSDLLPDGHVEGHYWVARNPTRGDSSPGSFKINMQTCKWKDFATSDPGGNDPVSLYRYLTGKSKMGEAARELGKRLGVTKDKKISAIKKKPNPKWEPIQPIPETTEPPPDGMVANQCWVYKDKHGQLIGYIMRKNRANGKKDFYPLTYCVNTETGETQWRYQGFKSPRPLYNVDVLSKTPELGVVIVEGEKTAEAAKRIIQGEAVVITWPGGSNAIDEVDWSELAGRRVAIWPDNDEPGKLAALKIADKLFGVAEVVKIVDPPADAAEGWDLGDAGDEWDKLKLINWIKDNAQVYAPKVETPNSKTSLGEIVYDGVNSTFEDGSQALKDAQESIVASQIAMHLKSHFIFDSSRSSWFQFDSIWNEVTETYFKNEFLKIMTWFYPKGFKSKLFSAIFNLVKINLLRAPIESAEHAGAIMDNWNQDKTLIPFRNGVLNVKTLELMPHAPELMFNWRLPYDYNPATDCPIILELIHNIADGDEPTKRVLISFLAAIIHGRSDIQKYLEIVGKPGSGKSTFIKIAENLVGKSNTVSTTMRQLTENRFETAEFYGKRLGIIADADQWAGSVEVFKMVVGQDPLRFERKHVQQGRPFIFGGLIIVAANGAIQSSDHSTAMARRRIPVHVDKVFPVEKIVPNLDEKIRAQMPGLINLLLAIKPHEIEDSLRDLKGLRTLDAMRSLVETMPIADWANQCLVFEAGEHCKIGEKRQEGGTFANSETWLYPSYLEFMERNGHKGGLAVGQFSKSLIEILERAKISTEKKRTKKGYVLKNLRVRHSRETQAFFFKDKNQPLLLTKEPFDVGDA